MTTPAYKPKGKSRAKTPEQLAEAYEKQLFETTRRSIAMQRYHPGAICRWRRAAPSGPNSKLAVVSITYPLEKKRETLVWSYDRVERLAAEVSDQDVFDFLAKRLDPETDSLGGEL